MDDAGCWRGTQQLGGVHYIALIPGWVLRNPSGGCLACLPKAKSLGFWQHCAAPPGWSSPFCMEAGYGLAPVHVGPTEDRSVLGILTDFCRTLPYYLPSGGWGELELLEAERKLAETPSFSSRKLEDTVWPAREAVAVLWRHWSSDRSACRA